jgi:hypothetical protein
VSEAIDLQSVRERPTSQLAVRGALPRESYVELVHASGHCHAPSCIQMELLDGYGNLLCRITPHYAATFDVERDHFVEPRAGGSADGAATATQPPFLTRIDPCQWGTAAEGLAPRPRLPLYGPHAFLEMRKLNNATRRVTGEMAIWQLRGVIVPAGETASVE